MCCHCLLILMARHKRFSPHETSPDAPDIQFSSLVPFRLLDYSQPISSCTGVNVYPQIKCELYKEKEVFLLLLHLQYCKKGLYEFDKAFHGLYSKDDQILIFLLQMKDESEDKVIVVDRIIKWKEPQDLIPSPPWRRSTRLNTNLSHIC
ncbi:uncharacterized protein LOC144287839 isoform X2 [Canis aureus]